ncbi:MAG: HEAT repeat domain-containing protein, partial [Pirellulaceae bacterium]
RDSRAINALCRAIVDSPTSEPYRAADAEVQWAAVDSLANFGARAIKPLCQLLDNSHAAVCRRAGWALVGIGRRAALSLCRIVADRSRDPLARQEAAASLGQLQDRRTVRILCHTLADENPAVRAAVVRALQGIGDPRAEKYLTRAMSDPDLQSLVSSDDRQQLAGVAWTATPWTYASLRYFTLEPDGTGKLIYGYGQTIYADIRCKWFLPRPGRLRLTYLESPGEQFVPAFRPTNENASKTIGYRLIEEPISGEKMSGRYEYHWTLELSDHPWPTNLNLPYGTPRVFYGGTE